MGLAGSPVFALRATPGKLRRFATIKRVGRATRSASARSVVPWPALNKIRNHLGMRLFSKVQNIEYQGAYQTPAGTIRVRIRFGGTNFSAI
jgi:hypothetical protein